MLEAAHGLRKCSKDCGFHNDQKATRGSKCAAVTEKLTPSEVKFKQKISYFYAPIISKKSRLDSDVVVKADTVTLSVDDSDYDPSQRPSKDSPLHIDDENLHHNRSKSPSFTFISDQITRFVLGKKLLHAFQPMPTTQYLQNFSCLVSSFLIQSLLQTYRFQDFVILLLHTLQKATLYRNRI